MRVKRSSAPQTNKFFFVPSSLFPRTDGRTRHVPLLPVCPLAVFTLVGDMVPTTYGWFPFLHFSSKYSFSPGLLLFFFCLAHGVVLISHRCRRQSAASGSAFSSWLQLDYCNLVRCVPVMSHPARPVSFTAGARHAHGHPFFFLSSSFPARTSPSPRYHVTLSLIGIHVRDWTVTGK